MYVYIKSEPLLWTVGFYAPDGAWNPESDHSSKESAAARASSLNGGGPRPREWFVAYRDPASSLVGDWRLMGVAPCVSYATEVEAAVAAAGLFKSMYYNVAVCCTTDVFSGRQ